MGYDLTINRFGALAGPHVRHADTNERRCDNAIIRQFQAQMIEMLRQNLVKVCHEKILKVAQTKAFLKSSDDFPEAPIEVSTMPMDEGEKVASEPALIGLLPSKRMHFTVDNMTWILRVRPSVTACALQERDGLSKLWWTFEGIPAETDPEVRPTEKQVSSFIGRTEEMEKAVMTPLYHLYRDSLRAITEKPPKEFELGTARVRISMSDNDDYKVGSLFDAIYLDGQDVDDIRSTNSGELAKEGLREFESLVSHITKYDPKAIGNKLATVDKQPGFRALYYRHTEKRQKTILAGLARRAENVPGFRFLSAERQRLEKSEEALRVRSAARRVSAALCGTEARLLEAAHPHP